MCAGVIALARVSHTVQHASNIHLDLQMDMLAWLWLRDSSQPGHGNGITDAWKQCQACELEKDKNHTPRRGVCEQEQLLKSPTATVNSSKVLEAR
jgi:hypothetical protein